MSCTWKQYGASRETQTNSLYLKSSTLPLVDSTGIIQLFGHCIATRYAMSRSHLKLTEIGTSCGRIRQCPKSLLITTVFEGVIHASLFVGLVQ